MRYNYQRAEIETKSEKGPKGFSYSRFCCYPFLVSRLCSIIDVDIMKEAETNWLPEYVDQAVAIILRENNTNFARGGSGFVDMLVDMPHFELPGVHPSPLTLPEKILTGALL